MGTAIGDTFSCMRTHQNQSRVLGEQGGVGRDLNDAVLAAVN